MSNEKEGTLACYECGSEHVYVSGDANWHETEWSFNPNPASLCDEKGQTLLNGFELYMCNDCLEREKEWGGFAFYKQDLLMYKLQYSQAERQKHYAR